MLAGCRAKARHAVSAVTPREPAQPEEVKAILVVASLSMARRATLCGMTTNPVIARGERFFASGACPEGTDGKRSPVQSRGTDVPGCSPKGISTGCRSHSDDRCH